MPYTDKVYSHFRFIAYEVQTSGPVAPGAVAERVTRVPLTEPPLEGYSEDARTRLRRLAAVVDLAARTVAKGVDAPGTLKIFVVPEFYFRPEGDTSYTSAQIADVVACLNGMFVHPDFEHWLFVCGSRLYRRTYPGVTGELYLNSCPVIKGGHVDSPRTNVQKRFFAGGDGVPGGGSIFERPTLKAIWDRWIVQKQCLVSVDNLRIGVEICADHDRNVLSNMVALRRKEHESEDNGPLQLQVLVACNLERVESGIAVAEGGYFFRNDGYADAMTPSEMYQIMASSRGSLTFGRAIAAEQSVPVPSSLVLSPGSELTERLNVYPVTAIPYK
jgi:hypothetical protein